MRAFNRSFSMISVCTLLIFAVSAILPTTTAARTLLQANPPDACPNPPPAQLNTTFNGYWFGSDAPGYDLLCLDAVDIESALRSNPPNFEVARSIYENGKNSRTARCAPRTLRQWAVSKGYVSSEGSNLVWNLFNQTFFSTNGDMFLDSWVSEALNGTGNLASASPEVRAAFLNTVARSSIMTVYLFNEIDSAWNKTKLGNVVAPPNGAAHNLDEGVAIWAGVGGQHNWGSLDGLAIEAGVFGGTALGQTSRAGNNTVAALVDLRNAVAQNASNLVDAYGAIRQRIIKEIIVMHTQMVLKCAQQMQQSPVSQAYAAAYYRTIQPFVANVSTNASEEILAAINFGGTPAINAAQRIHQAMTPVYRAFGITTDDIGKSALPSSTIDLSESTAYQSSTHGPHTPELAIDGKASTHSATMASAAPWWAVDLGKKVAVSSVTIKAPSPAGSPIKNLKIIVGNSRSASRQNENIQCASKIGTAINSGGTVEFTCAKPIIGSWVILQAKNKNPAPLKIENVLVKGSIA